MIYKTNQSFEFFDDNLEFYGNLLKSCISRIRITRIRISRGPPVFQNIFLYIFNFILLIYRYYVVSSKDGFLPPGTPCAKNSKFKKKSFCVMGRCLEFGNDMTPKQVLSNETLSDIRGMVINKPRSLRLKRELFIEPPKLGK